MPGAAHPIDLANLPMWLGAAPAMLGDPGPHLAHAAVRHGHPAGRPDFIPRDIPEAARRRRRLLARIYDHVLMLRPIVLVALLFGVVFTFTDMTAVYILTRGGPADATQVLPSLAFFTGILGGDLAQGAAISLFLFPLLWARRPAAVARRSEVT
jgi:hypothetical protein